VGLDLGSRSIKLVELEQAAGGPRIVKVLTQELPSSESGQPVDLVGWLQTALKEFRVQDVHLSVSGPQVAVRRLHVPQMSRQELPEAVKWEVREHVPFPVQEAVVDFRVVGDVWEKDVRKQDVLAAAAARPLVDELLKTVERAGGRVASVTPTHLALWRCVSALIPETTQGSVAVIELGASQTQVTIAKDGHVRLVRDLHVGSASLTEALVGVIASEEGAEIAIDRPKAEALKRRYGVLTDVTEGNTEEGLPLFHLASLMRPVLEDLLTELSRLFDFYKVQMEESGLSRVFLCGAGANLKQLQPFLANGLGMTVEIFNPLVRITDRLQPMEPEQIADTGPRLAVAIGLALGRGEGLNLLPVELKQARASAAVRRMWAQAATSLGAGAVAVYVGLHLVAFTLGQRLRSQQQEWARLNPAYSAYMEAAATQRALERSLAQVRAFLDRQPLWEGMFKEISTLVPSTIELDELTVEPAGATGSTGWRFHAQGRLAAGGSAREAGMAQLLETLERSPFFRDVQLTSSEMHSSDTGTTRFILDGQLE
jgi:type IV pilus assembly protein PilM